MAYFFSWPRLDASDGPLNRRLQCVDIHGMESPKKGVSDPSVSITFTANVPQSLFTTALPPPATVTQHSVFEHFGIPPKDYLRLAREGAFPTSRRGRLRIARYDVLLERLTDDAKAETRYREAVKEEPAAGKPKVDPQAYDNAVRWISQSRTHSEYRLRSNEVAKEGGKLADQYGPKLWDGVNDETGRPNPEYDEALYDHGMRLVLAASMVRWHELRRKLIESGELVLKKSKRK